jgi:hypothetical protein
MSAIATPEGSNQVPVEATPGQKEAHLAKFAKPDFGNGRYSAATAELYGDIIRLVPRMTRAEAEKAARDWSADIGRAMKDAKSSIKHGNANKDGKLNLKEACETVKGVYATTAMTFAGTIERLNNAVKYGAALGIKVEVKELDWKP